MNRESIFSRLFSLLQSLFLSGFFAIFPLAITIAAITIFYSIATKLLAPLRRMEPIFLQAIPGSEFVLVVLFIFAMGILVRYVILQPFIHHIEYIISKIPFINTIHSALKAVVDFFKMHEHEMEERQVVLIPFADRPFYHVAFLIGSGKNYDNYIDKASEQARVFIPTSPIPGHGFFMIMPRSCIIETSLTFEDAMKIIVSCGLISPERSI